MSTGCTGIFKVFSQKVWSVCTFGTPCKDTVYLTTLGQPLIKEGKFESAKQLAWI